MLLPNSFTHISFAHQQYNCICDWCVKAANCNGNNISNPATLPAPSDLTTISQHMQPRIPMWTQMDTKHDHKPMHVHTLAYLVHSHSLKVSSWYSLDLFSHWRVRGWYQSQKKLKCLHLKAYINIPKTQTNCIPIFMFGVTNIRTYFSNGSLHFKGGSSQGINSRINLFHDYCSAWLYLVKVPGYRFPSQMWEESSWHGGAKLP